jgi:hypothetical protein
MVLLVPRDLRVEHHVDPTKELSNEQLDSMIAHITERLEQKANEARIINAPALPAPVEPPEDIEAELYPPKSKYKPYKPIRPRGKRRVPKVKAAAARPRCVNKPSNIRAKMSQQYQCIFGAFNAFGTHTIIGRKNA